MTAGWYGSKYIGNDKDADHSKGQHQFYPDAKDKTEPRGDSHHPGLLYVSAGNELADHGTDERAKKDADKPEGNSHNCPDEGTDYCLTARTGTFCTETTGDEIGDKGDKRQYAKEDHRSYTDVLETIRPGSKEQANINQWRSGYRWKNNTNNTDAN